MTGNSTWKVLLALAALPLVAALPLEIPDIDPAQYATVARHIVESGDWLHLSDATGPFVNKPPLMMWAQAAVMSGLGVGAIAARLPALFFALVLVFSTWLVGRELFNDRVARLGALLALGSLAAFDMVAVPRVDAAVAAMSSASIAVFVAARKKPGLHTVAWLLAGLAVLSKGPLGLALIVLALGPEALRRRPERKQVLSSLAGLGLVAAMAAPYYLSLHSEEAAIYVLLKQSFGRLIGQSGYDNDTSVLFFFHTALWVFLPFSPMLIAALVTRAQRGWKARALPPSPQRLIVWWFVLPFAVFSLSDFKLPHYLYVLTAPAALLAAEWIESAPRRSTTVWFSVLAIGGAALAGLTAFFCFPGTWSWLAIIPAIALIFALRRTAWSGALSLTPLFAAAALSIIPAINQFELGPRALRAAAAADPSARLIAFVEMPMPFSAAFASGKPPVPMGLSEFAERVRDHATSVAFVDGVHWPDFEAEGLVAERLETWPVFPTSRLTRDFLLADRRPTVTRPVELVRVRLK